MFENYGGENCLIFFLIKEIVKVSMSRKLSKLWDFNCHPIVRMLYTYFYQPFHSPKWISYTYKFKIDCST